MDFSKSKQSFSHTIYLFFLERERDLIKQGLRREVRMGKCE